MQQAPARLNKPTPPLDRRIASLLSKEIAEGAWLPGDQVPTETELAERFEVGFKDTSSVGRQFAP